MAGVVLPIVFTLFLIGRAHTKAEINSGFRAVFRERFGRHDFEMDGVTRAMFLNLHNGVRRVIARGKYFGVNESLGPAKNMYMLHWDYNLERIAEESIESCSTTESTFEAKHYARNVDVMKSVGLPDWYLLNAYMTVLKWKNEAREHSLDANNTIGHSGLFEFANMAYSKTTRVGCSIKWCRSFYITACVYDKVGNRLGTSLWETSTSECIWDSDCTTYDGSTCDSGLCVDSKNSSVVELIQPTINPTVDVSETTTSDSFPWNANETTQTIISFPEDKSEITQPTTSSPADTSETTSPSTSSPENTETAQLTTDKCNLGNGMTDEARNAMLNEHNRLRSLVAKGLAENPKGDNGYAPKAARMLKMVYDCKIEESASRHAQKCSFEKSGISERPGLGENLFQVSGMRRNFSEIGIWATQSWFSQLKEEGVQPHNRFTWVVANQHFTVSQYTQMVWDRTYKLGCGAAICSGSTIVVCHYGPGGNSLNEEIYTVGEPCETDDHCRCDRCTCSRDEALCVKRENKTPPLVLTFPPLFPYNFQLPIILK